MNEEIKNEAKEIKKGVVVTTTPPNKSIWKMASEKLNQPVKRKDVIVGAVISITLASLGLGF